MDPVKHAEVLMMAVYCKSGDKKKAASRALYRASPEKRKAASRAVYRAKGRQLLQLSIEHHLRKGRQLLELSIEQTDQVSRFQRDPPDFTRSIPFPDAPPSGVYKIPRLILFLEASRTISASTCAPSVHACILYCTTVL